ncbi:hypothetical protein INR38_07915 [Delftia sp. SD018]|uniref:hypothetical protein n=1 Tax=unclassified Delftia TaxID=2613839 RepID=UPI001A964056|nr:MULTISPECIES: hypothetical protein [unclassified Delftia]MBO0988701.1 hypothetical protein [Delftia sp. SD083]MBO1034007.1 hypothetical protein [Delftia sp. SD018]
MMKNLLDGVPASVVFRTIMQADLTIDSRKLGNILTLEYPNVDPGASMAIRKWLNPERGYDLPDEEIDALIFHYLRDAGYIS